MNFQPKFSHLVGDRRSQPLLLPPDARPTIPVCPGSSLLRDGPPGANLFLYGVPSDWNENPLLEICQEFGHIVGIRVPSSASDGPRLNRGFGFVSYDRTDCAHQALSVLPAISFLGKAFKVQLKRGEEHLCPPELVHLVQPSSGRRHHRRGHEGYESPTWSEREYIQSESIPDYQRMPPPMPHVVSSYDSRAFEIPQPAAPTVPFDFTKDFSPPVPGLLLNLLKDVSRPASMDRISER